MKALILADTPVDVDLAATVADNQVEAVFTCGDLHKYDIAGLADVSVPKYGVYGNHCRRGYLDELGIIDLHRRMTTLPNGMSIVGLEGCVRYKNEPDVLYSQQEYAEFLSRYPATVDVILTHTPPAGINDHDDPAHLGITALRDYVDSAQPQYLLHGHTYPDEPVTDHGSTKILYTYGMRIVDLVGQDNS